VQEKHFRFRGTFREWNSKLDRRYFPGLLFRGQRSKESDKCCEAGYFVDDLRDFCQTKVGSLLVLNKNSIAERLVQGGTSGVVEENERIDLLHYHVKPADHELIFERKIYRYGLVKHVAT